jgi:glutathione S-transferase
MEYATINDVIAADGLRLVIVRAVPSPWSQAAKAMLEYKGLDFIVAAQEPGQENVELAEWSGQNSGPVVAWNNDAPLSRWDDILWLLERLAPARPLIPSDFAERTECLGLAHGICGESGLGWNRRLDMFHQMLAQGAPVSGLAEKYGYTEENGELARERTVHLLNYLSARLTRQRKNGSDFFVGNALTAVDFYWAAFSNFICLPSPEDCPMRSSVRDTFSVTSTAYSYLFDSILIEHRERIMQAHFKIPMEF